MPAPRPQRVAIVHDWLIDRAGSERVLEQILALFPDATLYTLIDRMPAADRARLQSRRTVTSFLDRWPGITRYFTRTLPLMPLAMQQFDLCGYDLVISSSHAVAKGVIVPPNALHLCYCHSPMRYVWDMQGVYLTQERLDRGLKSWLARALLHRLRLWDMASHHGAEEIAATRAALGWSHEPFVIPEDVRAAWDQHARGARAEKAWRRRFNRYRREFPELAAAFDRRMRGELPADWSQLRAAALAAAAGVGAGQATRASSQLILNAIGPGMGELLGGSADLTGSVNTLRKDSKPVTPADVSGNYVYYGVREFAMTAMMNGLALHGGFIPYAGTFLVFSDYARNAVRLAALMHQRVLLVYTHDSIGLGEDGPTHQPIEHLASLRAMPNLSLWRPCDATETAVAWLAGIELRGGPTCLVLTRQALPQQPRDAAQLAAIANGGYILIEPEAAAGALPEAIVIATGSEVAPAAEAVRAANAAGRRVRLVSMPSTDTFDAQDKAWREHVLPRAVSRRIAVEAAATQSWWKYVGSDGRVLGIDRFGASGKAPALFDHYGLTAAHIGRALAEMLGA